EYSAWGVIVNTDHGSNRAYLRPSLRTVGLSMVRHVWESVTFSPSTLTAPSLIFRVPSPLLTARPALTSRGGNLWGPGPSSPTEISGMSDGAWCLTNCVTKSAWAMFADSAECSQVITFLARAILASRGLC